MLYGKYYKTMNVFKFKVSMIFIKRKGKLNAMFRGHYIYLFTVYTIHMDYNMGIHSKYIFQLHYKHIVQNRIESR